MEWGEIAQRIYKTLEEKGYEHLVQQMIDENGIGGTSGEMFLIVTRWLAKMRNSNNPIFNLVKDDAELLFEIGYNSRYFTKATLKKL